MELLKKHRSIRSFKSDLISSELLNDILECGIRGSNTGNMQLYSIVVTQSMDMKKLLLPLHFNQKMVLDSPVLLTICLDFYRFSKWCELHGTHTDLFNMLWLLNGTIDASILAQNISVAAESKNLGICYLGTALYNAPEISEVLNLPKGVIPVTSICLGYPEFVPELTDRLPLASIVHQERYNAPNLDEISEIYSEKEMRTDSVRFVNENKMNSLAEVYAKVRYKSEDNLWFSKKIRVMLENHGFNLHQ